MSSHLFTLFDLPRFFPWLGPFVDRWWWEELWCAPDFLSKHCTVMTLAGRKETISPSEIIYSGTLSFPLTRNVKGSGDTKRKFRSQKKLRAKEHKNRLKQSCSLVKCVSDVRRSTSLSQTERASSTPQLKRSGCGDLEHIRWTPKAIAPEHAHQISETA